MLIDCYFHFAYNRKQCVDYISGNVVFALAQRIGILSLILLFYAVADEFDRNVNPIYILVVSKLMPLLAFFSFHVAIGLYQFV